MNTSKAYRHAAIFADVLDAHQNAQSVKPLSVRGDYDTAVFRASQEHEVGAGGNLCRGERDEHATKSARAIRELVTLWAIIVIAALALIITVVACSAIPSAIGRSSKPNDNVGNAEKRQAGKIVLIISRGAAYDIARLRRIAPTFTSVFGRRLALRGLRAGDDRGGHQLYVHGRRISELPASCSSRLASRRHIPAVGIHEREPAIRGITCSSGSGSIEISPAKGRSCGVSAKLMLLPSREISIAIERQDRCAVDDGNRT